MDLSRARATVALIRRTTQRPLGNRGGNKAIFFLLYDSASFFSRLFIFQKVRDILDVTDACAMRNDSPLFSRSTDAKEAQEKLAHHKDEVCTALYTQ